MVSAVRHVVLLRGINLGSRNRVAMPRLRELLSDEGFGNVRTYLQSGNVVLESELAADAVAERCKHAIAEQIGLELEVLVRTGDELAEVVRRNPLVDEAVDPKRYQVTFLARPLEQDAIERLAGLARPPERLVANGRELYAWHPEGIARSKLSAGLAAAGLGVPATARNWITVTNLLGMVED